MSKPTWEQHLEMLKNFIPDEYEKMRIEDEIDHARGKEIAAKIETLCGQIKAEQNGSHPEQIKQTVAEIRETAGLRFEISPTGAAEDCLKLLAVVDHLQKTVEAQAEEIRLWKELNKAQSAYMDSQYWQPPDGIGGSDEALAAWMKARTALSAFDSTRDKEKNAN